MDGEIVAETKLSTGIQEVIKGAIIILALSVNRR